jgi:hypothetical protein
MRMTNRVRRREPFRRTISSVTAFVLTVGITICGCSCAITRSPYEDVKILSVFDSIFVEYHLIVAATARNHRVLILSPRVSRDSLREQEVAYMRIRRGESYRLSLNPMVPPVVCHRLPGPIEHRGTHEAFTLADDSLKTITIVWDRDTIRTEVFTSSNIIDRYYLPSGQ